LSIRDSSNEERNAKLGDTGAHPIQLDENNYDELMKLVMIIIINQIQVMKIMIHIRLICY